MLPWGSAHSGLSPLPIVSSHSYPHILTIHRQNSHPLSSPFSIKRVTPPSFAFALRGSYPDLARYLSFTSPILDIHNGRVWPFWCTPSSFAYLIFSQTCYTELHCSSSFPSLQVHNVHCVPRPDRLVSYDDFVSLVRKFPPLLSSSMEILTYDIPYRVRR